MTDPKKPARDPIAALLSFAVDIEETPEEAEQNLREMGVDVEAFLARTRERRDRHDEEVRTSWLGSARERLKTESITSPTKYGFLERPELLAEYAKRQHSSQAFFHKLEELSDDDLRTLLTDLDDLGDEQDET